MKKNTQIIVLCLLFLSLLFPSIAKATVATAPTQVVPPELASRLPREPIDPICIILYEICVNFTRNRSCAACLARCRAQGGNWPFEICPIPARSDISSSDKHTLKDCQPIDAVIQSE